MSKQMPWCMNPKDCCWGLPASFNRILAVLVLVNLREASKAFNLDTQFPLVYEDPTKDAERGTYFGFSVIMYSNQGENNIAWIQVGAPRANSSFNEHSEIHEPGVVYRCSFWPPRPCQPMRLDRKGNEKLFFGDGTSYWDHKDGAWIGAAMDVQPGPGGRVVMCGPRWIDQLHIHDYGEIYQVGVCYWMPAEEDETTHNGITADAEKLLPLLDEDRFKYTQYSWKGAYVYDFGVGEAGISVHMPLTKEKSELILGAPGILNWRGGTILYQDGISFIGGGLNKRSTSIGAFSQLNIPSPKTSLRFNEFDYLGYQVSSGKFFAVNETLYVASAPRAVGFRGKVLIFRQIITSNSRQSGGNSLVLLSRAVGIQFGEYFGASLAVGDLNNDGLDDLIVGAPLYVASSTASGIGYDEGRVSVYLGSDVRQLIETIRIAGKVAGARFGSAISYLGDLDSDGYGEVAIGAPYEDQGRGVVYIFPGNKEVGLLSEAAQRLIAHDTYPYLRGFGSSISIRPADIDQNGCPDVAVGAYVSGHAVVFRGRPVVRWQFISPHSIQEHIPRNATVLTLLDVCIKYVGNHAPNSLGVWRTLEVDPTNHRCNIKNKTTYSEMIHLTKDEPYCESQEITMMPKIQNFISPIEVNIWYQLPEEKEFQEISEEKGHSEFKIQPILIRRDVIEGTDDFCKDCPISQGSPRTSISIPFEMECGKDNICHADLSITGVLPQLSKSSREKKLSFVIGSTRILQLKVLVSNKETAELAFLTFLYVELGTPAKISRIPPACKEIPQPPFLHGLSEYSSASRESLRNSSINNGLSHASKSVASLPQSLPNTKADSLYISCGLDNPLHPNSYREVQLELDMTDACGSEGMQLRAWVTTSSNETNTADNSWDMYLPFFSEADVTMAGRSENEFHTYFKGSKTENEGRINFLHVYEVQKFGHSPLEKVDIELHIPSVILNKNDKKPIAFLSIKRVEGKQDEQLLTCKVLESNIATSQYNDNLSTKYPISQNLMGQKSAEKVEVSKRAYSMNNTALRDTSQVQSNFTLYLNCSSLLRSENYSVKCITVNCEAGPFLNSLTVAQVFLFMELNVKPLDSVMEVQNTILFATNGVVKVKEPANLNQPILGKPDQALASTVFVEEISEGKVESWILAVSIATGIMFLLLIAMGLSKAGFFERKKKAELEEFKRGQLLGEALINVILQKDQNK